MSSKTEKCDKLCRRGHFLRHDSVPNELDMRRELGSQLADAIMETMSPACKAWMGIGKKLVGPGRFCSNTVELKANIHEYIVHYGSSDERKRKAERIFSKEQLELCKFECRQKIGIARDEERKRMQEQLEEATLKLEEKFNVMKAKLEEDFVKARRENAKFMCRNLRKQAQQLIKSITRRYRTQLEEEVSARVNLEVKRLSEQIESVVQNAVEKQKAIDTMAMQKMCYRYEEMLKNAEHQAACRQLTSLTHEICSCWAKHFEPPSNPVLSCPNCNAVVPLPSSESDSVSVQERKVLVGSSELLDPIDVFFVETCPMMPEADSTSSSETAAIVEADSSHTLEAITFDGRVYAQPQYYRKIHEQLFPTPMITWENFEPESVAEERSIDSDFIREMVERILADDEVFKDKSDLPVEQEATATETVSEAAAGLSSSMSSISDISDLFDLEQTENAIEILVNGITLKYIRAPERGSD
ncbi:uncharacterized protein LOC129779296 [Toxorhynchites rutilus septentrionalis]|uniref:uncharacterized protein LOC129779296 n=1 Tax=Toxorhynchites rutilus septentrionalis TaxID=329112 RepID=UPI0024790DEE|nr:uncharacterized protein LOC129779296 [Toxorhynchites rutilus septentrionalis]